MDGKIKIRQIISIAVALLLPLTAYSQTWKRNRVEVFMGLPVNHYFGDVGNTAQSTMLTGYKDFRIRAIRGGFGGGLGYRVNPFISAQVSLNAGFFGNTDEGSDYTNRGYRFSTFGTEILAKGLYYIIPESDQNYYYSIMDLRGGLRHLNKPLSLYAFIGAGGLFFSASANDAMLSRVPLPGVTKKEVDESKFFTFVLPIGVGVKYEFYPRIQLGVELGARYVATDYLDAFSSVHSNYNDMYYTMNINVYYKVPYHKLLKRSFWRF